MKKRFYFLFALLILSAIVNVTNVSAQKRKHVKINPNQRYERNEMVLKSSQNQTMEIRFTLNSYDLIGVDGLNAYKVGASQMGDILKKGAPDLPKFAQSIMIPSDAKMRVEVVGSEFIEVDNLDVAPSKGNLTREIDPRTIAYTYGAEYQKDSYYPAQRAELNDPYILRNIRGQALVVYPFSYNPVQKKLRIYTRIDIKVTPTGEISTKNILPKTKSSSSDRGFEKVYESHFLNYAAPGLKYTPLNDEPGKMLIICYGDFMDEMADFVNWKKQKGIPVEMVNVSSIGNASSIKSYVTNYYNTNGLTYLLLVGDAAQVPPSSTSAGDSDNNYGFIVGNDHYIDIFVGRFSAESGAQVTTQVERTIHYERDVTTADTWLASGVGIASNEGYNPSDAEHMNTIENKLEGYGYSISRCYQDGGSASQLTNLLNNGKGILNYIGHGSNYGFASMVYTSTNVNSLTNDNKLPFIFDVACVNGNFKSITCFAEAWLRATHNGNPTGAMAICASTINQSWVPPMIAQNEMNDILVESYANNIRRTFSGLALNGMFKMVDVHGYDGEKMIDTWTIFGDPSLQVRTKTPAAMTVNHPATVAPGSNQLTVTTPVNDAVVALTLNGEILGTAKTNNGTATVSFSPLPSSGAVKLTVTAYNKIPYVGNVIISGSGSTDVVANFSANKSSIYVGESVSFTDLSAGGPTSWNWSFTGGTPSVSSTQNPTVTYSTAGTYSVSLTASNSGSSDTKTITDMITVSDAPAQSYCDATTNGCGSYEYISGLVFAGIDHSSVCNGYSDFTSYSANVERGNSYNITVNIGRPDSRNYVTAWFDWNRDGDFEDAGEEYVLSYKISGGSGTATGSVAVPTDALAGSTRMRIRVTYNVTPQPCGNTTYGEIEDYSVSVAGESRETAERAMENKTIRIFPNPAEDEFQIEGTGISGEMTVKISNLTGSTIRVIRTNGSKAVNISDLNTGIYLLQIDAGDQSWIKKLVVK
jgi:PKD repeat protein